MIQHPTLETVYSIKDLDVGKCIPAQILSYNLNPGYIYKFGKDVDLEPNTKVTDQIKSFFFIMIGYDEKGNKLLLADRVLGGILAPMSMYLNRQGYKYSTIGERLGYIPLCPTNYRENSNLYTGKFEATSKTEYSSSYDVYNAFNHDGYHQSLAGINQYIQVHFIDEPKRAIAYSMEIYGDSDSMSYNPKDLKLQACNDPSDESNWVTLHDIEFGISEYNCTHIGLVYFFEFTNENQYSYYRLTQKEGTTSDYCIIRSFNLYEKKPYIVSDFNNYNLYLDIPSLYMLNNLYKNNLNGKIELTDENVSNLWNLNNTDGYYTVIKTLYNQEQSYIYKDKDKTSHVSQRSGSIKYRPVLICEPKKQGEIKSYTVSSSFKNKKDLSGSISLSIDLSDDFLLPVDIEVKINKILQDKYKIEDHNSKNISIDISKDELRETDNIINVFITSKENGWTRTFNHRITNENIFDDNYQYRDLGYNEDTKDNSSDMINVENSGYTAEDDQESSFKVKLNPSEKGEISKISSTELNMEYHNESIELKKKSSKVIDEYNKIVSYNLNGLKSITRLQLKE